MTCSRSGSNSYNTTTTTTTNTNDIIYVAAGATVTDLIYKIIMTTQEREPYRNFFLRFVCLGSFLCFLFAGVLACLLFDIESSHSNNGNNGFICRYDMK